MVCNLKKECMTGAVVRKGLEPRLVWHALSERGLQALDMAVVGTSKKYSIKYISYKWVLYIQRSLFWILSGLERLFDITASVMQPDGWKREPDY